QQEKGSFKPLCRISAQVNQHFLGISKGNSWRLFQQKAVKVNRFVWHHLIISWDKFSNQINQGSNERKEQNGIGDIEGSMGKSNCHSVRQMQLSLQPLQKIYKWRKHNHKTDGNNKDIQYMRTRNTFGRHISSQSC